MAPLPPLAIPTTSRMRSWRGWIGSPRARRWRNWAVLGRTFAYELLQAVASLDELALWRGLVQLGRPRCSTSRGCRRRPRIHSSTPCSRRRLSVTAPEHAATVSPAHGAGGGRALSRPRRDPARAAGAALHGGGPERPGHSYWQQAGERALQRSAHVEAIAHLSRGLGLLETLPPTPERTQQAIVLYSALGGALMATRGYAAPEVEQAYRQAYQLCQQAGDPGPLFPVLAGLALFYTVRAEHQTAREVAEQLLTIAQDQPDPVFRLQAHTILEAILFYLGELAAAQAQAEQGIALYDRQQHRSLVSLYGGNDPGVTCLAEAATIQWLLGYPDQACKRGREALALAQELAHPLSRAFALIWVARFHLQRRDWQAAAALLEALIALCTEQGFAFYWRGHGLARVCAGRARPSRGGDRRDTPGPGGHAGHRGRGGTALVSGSVGGSVWAERAGHSGLTLLAERWRPCPQPGNTAGSQSCIASRVLLALSAAAH